MEFKTAPFSHQLEEWDKHRDDRIRALFWEQGTGKTKEVIDQAAWLFLKGEIDALLVLAPNGVHENWATDELPDHCPVPYRAHSWSTKSATTRWHRASAQETLESPHLAVLLMSYDGFMTQNGRKFARLFADQRRALGVLDESQRIKTPGAKRTRSVVAFGNHLRIKRILSGTPVTNKPFDIYPQLKFLDKDFWKSHGFASYEAFKTYFGVWEDRVNGHTGQRFKQCVYFKNLDQLNEIVRSVSSRVTKEKVLDLPDKVHSKRYFSLTARQRRAYDQVKNEFLTLLDSGELVTAPLVITRILRLQQITCGYLPSDDCENLNPFPENPRMRLLLDTLTDVEGKAIIFARFRHDIVQLVEELGPACVRYDGQVSDADRLEARRRFQDPDGPRFFVGNPAACATGLTLHRAKTVIYYSNSFDLEHRLQSEDRAHRIGQTDHVRYIDLVAEGTVDAKIVASLRNKLSIASKITGDEVREWL